jgi:hypothetical protein
LNLSFEIEEILVCLVNSGSYFWRIVQVIKQMTDKIPLENRITIQREQESNSYTFIVQKENHTFGGLLVIELNIH